MMTIQSKQSFKKSADTNIQLHVLIQRCRFDIRTSVHHNIIPSYSQQDEMFLDLFISKDALHFSGGSSVYHREHTTVNEMEFPSHLW